MRKSNKTYFGDEKWSSYLREKPLCDSKTQQIHYSEDKARLKGNIMLSHRIRFATQGSLHDKFCANLLTKLCVPALSLPKAHCMTNL